MNKETALAWANHLSGYQFTLPGHQPMVYKTIRDHVRTLGADFGGVGEDDDYYMVITQSADFLGYKDMDSSLIPHFKEGLQEHIAPQKLHEEGVAYFITNRIPRI
jgi:hypothetical protein